LLQPGADQPSKEPPLSINTSPTMQRMVPRPNHIR
jgi:hypothetical protein